MIIEFVVGIHTSVDVSLFLIFNTYADSTRRVVVELSVYSNISTTVNDAINGGCFDGVTFPFTSINHPSRNIKILDYIFLHETKSIADDLLYVNDNRVESLLVVPTHQVLIPE